MKKIIMSLALILPLLAGVWLTATPEPTQACTCSHGTPDYYWKRADMTFMGRVIEHGENGLMRLAVGPVWKGEPYQLMYFTYLLGECGPTEYKMHHDYIVYGYLGKDENYGDVVWPQCISIDANEERAEEHIAYLDRVSARRNPVPGHSHIFPLGAGNHGYSGMQTMGALLVGLLIGIARLILRLGWFPTRGFF